MEKVLLQWPRRPRTRHHSSSSEDFSDHEEDNTNGDKMVEGVDKSPNSLDGTEANNNQNNNVSLKDEHVIEKNNPVISENNISLTVNADLVQDKKQVVSNTGQESKVSDGAFGSQGGPAQHEGPQAKRAPDSPPNNVEGSGCCGCVVL